MSETQSESADADTDAEQNDEEFTYYPQVTQHPTTIIEGEIVDIVTGADIDASVENTGSSFGIVFEDPEVVADGDIWKNSNIPEGFATTSEFNDALRVAINGDDVNYVRGREVTDEYIEQSRKAVAEALDVDEGDDFTDLDYGDHKVGGTDYKVADESDKEVEVSFDRDGNEKGVDVGGGTFQSNSVDAFESDRIMVWYSGMSGQFVGRALDFNGMPFARYTDPDDEDELPYLIKGLFQGPIGWRGDSDIEQYGDVPTTDRSELARAEQNGGMGRPPRVVRPPVLRDDIDGRAFIAIGRYNSGNMFEARVGRAAEDYESLIETLRADELDSDDYDSLEMKYDQSPEETLNAEFDNPGEVFALYHGEGWAPEPEEVSSWAEGSGDSGGSFDTPDVDIDGDSVDHPTEQEVEFAQGIAEKLAGTGVSPDDEIFPTEDGGNTDLAGIIDARSDTFSVDPDVDAIREVVYENTAHLSTEDL